MSEPNYKELIKIDRHRLDDHLVEQAALFHDICDAVAYACSRRDKLYNDIKETFSELSVDYRQEMVDEGTKVTDRSVESYVLDHARYRKAIEDHLKAKLEADLKQGLKESWHQRTYMLRELTQLYVSGYYTDSSVRGDTHKAQGHRSQVNKERSDVKRKELRRKREGSGED